MTDEKQPKQQADEEQEQADLELDEEQTDEVKGGGRYGGPTRSGQALKGSEGRSDMTDEKQPKQQTDEKRESRQTSSSTRSRRTRSRAAPPGSGTRPTRRQAGSKAEPGGKTCATGGYPAPSLVARSTPVRKDRAVGAMHSIGPCSAPESGATRGVTSSLCAAERVGRDS